MIGGRHYKHTCIYSGVTLYPATAYSREVVELATGNSLGGFAREPAYSVLFDDTPLTPYSRHTACDADGQFRFEHVADGRYYLVANITWLVKTSRFGGAVVNSIEVGGASSRTISLETTMPY